MELWFSSVITSGLKAQQSRGPASLSRNTCLGDPGLESGGPCDLAVLSICIGLPFHSTPNTLHATLEATTELPEVDDETKSFCNFRDGSDIAIAIFGTLTQLVLLYLHSYSCQGSLRVET